MNGGILDWLITVGLPAVVGAVSAIGGQFIFHNEEKTSKQLDNEAKRAEMERARADEWRALYMESKADSDRKEDVIREYQIREHDNMIEKARLEARCAALECQRCEVYECVKRRPPLKEQYIESEKKYEDGND